jgi:hypothetical protein
MYIFTKIIILILINLILINCSSVVDNVFGPKEDNPPEEITLPENPLEKAAVQGLMTSYRESTMWQIQNVQVIGTTPMAPSGILIELQDPKEVHCVCLQYEARYKVSWSTSQGSPWEKTIRNILVIKTQSNEYMPLKPLNICNPICG